MPFQACPSDVRRNLYTTNAMKALNAKLRRVTRASGRFPTDEAAVKPLYLALNRTERAWKMPPCEWRPVSSAVYPSLGSGVARWPRQKVAVLFGKRFTKAMAG